MTGAKAATRQANVAEDVSVRGPVYNESMCLIQEGRLCVSELPFVYAPIAPTDTQYQGVLGLAKRRHGQINYVKQL